MTSSTHDLVASLLGGDVPAFALLRRRDRPADHVTVLTGESHELESLQDLRDLTSQSSTPRSDGGRRAQVLAAIPYRQVSERGYDCIDDHAPVVALRVTTEQTVPMDVLLDAVRAADVPRCSGSFDLSDGAYAAKVEQILHEEIDRGAGANFVIHRTFVGSLGSTRPEDVAVVFASLLRNEPSAYWTFAFVTPGLILVGASPEMHARLEHGTFTMNPVSGTLRHGQGAPTQGQLLDFLADGKESSELAMVLDEELKIVAALCHDEIRVSGPRLNTMSRLTHTEYLVSGRTSLGPADVLASTMFCPTVTGSPLENATRVIARHEAAGRGWYSGALALFEQEPDGSQSLDSTILIRTAEIDPATSTFALRVGCTIVRGSDAEAEALETRAKAAAVLTAMGVSTEREAPALPTALSRHVSEGRRRFVRQERGDGEGTASGAPTPEVEAALVARNAGLSSFWVAGAPDTAARRPALRPFDGLSAVVLDAEDRFTAMLTAMLRASGMEVTVRSCLATGDLSSFDLVVAGPGPGDPGDGDDPRVLGLDAAIQWCLDHGRPLVAICLSHQVLARRLDLPVRRRARANQGTQSDVDLFGRARTVGFYNSFAAHLASYSPGTAPTTVRTAHGVVEAARWSSDGEVAALRGPHFASVQFHPESVLTLDGPDILHELVAHALRRPGAPRTVSAPSRDDEDRTTAAASPEQHPALLSLEMLSTDLLDEHHGGFFSQRSPGARSPLEKTLVDQAAGAISLAQFGKTRDVLTAMAGLEGLSSHTGHAGFVAAATGGWVPVLPRWHDVQEQLFAAASLLVCAHRTSDLAQQVRAVDLINTCLGLETDGALPPTVRPDWRVAGPGTSPSSTIAAVHALAWADVLGEDGIDFSVLPRLTERLVAWAARTDRSSATPTTRARLGLALLHSARLLHDDRAADLAHGLVPRGAEEGGSVSVAEAAILHTVSVLADRTGLGGARRGTTGVPGQRRSRAAVAARRQLGQPTMTLEEAARVRALGHEISPDAHVGGRLGAVM